MKRDAVGKSPLRTDPGFGTGQIEPVVMEVVPGGSRTYIWIGTPRGHCIATISGASLRALERRLAKARGNTESADRKVT